jgi:hypothetical protein
MCSRHQMLGHAGGRSLGRLVLAAVQVRIKMLVSVGLVALLERQKKSCHKNHGVILLNFAKCMLETLQ